MAKVIEIVVPGFPAVVETVTVGAGPQGPPGEAGSNGYSPILTWDDDQIAIDGTVSGPHLTGPPGEPGEPGDPGGPPGPQGDPGPRGYSVLSGSSAPTTQGVDGDFYLDTTAYAIYGPKNAGNWGSPTSIVGPTGNAGATGATGAQGPKGDTGNTGPQGPAGADGSPDTASQVLAKLITVDGAASGLDADLLDGNHAAAFVLTGDSRLSDARTPTSHDHASNKLAQANTHESADTDSDTTALHHTLGTGANQACAGNDSRLSDARTPTTHTHTGVYEPVLDGSGVLAKLVTVDGASSGLDADLLDGQQATAFAATGHNHTGTYQPLDADLTALAALTGTGAWAKRTGADTWSLTTPTPTEIGAEPALPYGPNSAARFQAATALFLFGTFS